jgi:hypothetical protein
MSRKDSHNASTITSEELVFLEDIHIFALANLLCRPIVVLSEKYFGNIEPIRLRGIYLPLLMPAETCIHDPIVIAYHNQHFVPLMFALDSAEITKFESVNRDQNNNNKSTDGIDFDYRIRNGASYFHFENVDKFEEDRRLDAETYNAIVDSFIKERQDVSGSLVGYKKRESKFYHILPLVFSDLVSMRVHFATEEERTPQDELLDKYLNLVTLRINESQLDFKSDALVADQKILACFLSRSTELLSNKSGLSIYVDFLSESMRQKQNEIVYESRRRPRSSSSGSPAKDEARFEVVSSVSPTKSTPNRSNNSSNNSNHVVYASNKCKTDGCSSEGNSRYYGYCYDCFRANYMNQERTRQEERNTTHEVRLFLKNLKFTQLKNMKKKFNGMVL